MQMQSHDLSKCSCCVQLLGYTKREIEDVMTIFQLTHPSSLADTLAMGSRLFSQVCGACVCFVCDAASVLSL